MLLLTLAGLAFGIVDEAHASGVFAYIKARVRASAVGFPGGAYPVQFLLLALYRQESDLGHFALEVPTA